jgi:ATP-dependent Clp protease ATP-binding subunit ClpA
MTIIHKLIRRDLAESLNRTKNIEKFEDKYREVFNYIKELGKKLVLFIDHVNNPPPRKSIFT